MKKIPFILFGLFVGILFLMGPTTSFAQSDSQSKQFDERQPHLGRDLNQERNPVMEEEGKGAAPGSAGITLTQGKLSGEVVNVDKTAGVIEIKTDQGVVNKFNLEGDAKRQLDRIKEGDRVNLVMELRAQEAPSQQSPGMQRGG